MLTLKKKEILIKKFITEFKAHNYPEVIKTADKLLRKKLPKKLKAFLLMRTGISYEEQGDIENAVKRFQKVLTDFEDTRDFNLYKAQVLRELSYISYYQGDYESSIEYLRKSNEYFEKMKAQDYNLAKNNLNIGAYLVELGQISRAKQILEELNSRAINLQSTEMYTRTLNLLGIMKLYEESDTDEAIKLFKKALASLDLEYDDEDDHRHSNLKVIILFNLGWAYKEKNELEKAFKSLERIEDIKCTDNDIKTFAELLKAELMVQSGRIDEAERILLEMPSKLEKKQGFKFLVEVFAFLSELKMEKKDFEQASNMLNACFELLDKVGPFEKAIVYVTFGKLKFEEEEYFESLKYTFEAIKMIKESGFSFTPLKMKKVLSSALRALSKTIEKILKRIQDKDQYTLEHSVRVAFYALKISEALYISVEKRFEITIGGLLHDIGKIKIPADILTKPGRLTDEEFDIIKKHPIYGFEIAEEFGLPNTIKNIIRYHHQKYNGENSYPDNILGDQIPIEAQIVTLCDIFDAMTSKRPYRAAISFENVLKYFKENVDNISNRLISNTFIRFLEENTDLIHTSMKNFEELWKMLINEIFENSNLKVWSKS